MSAPSDAAAADAAAAPAHTTSAASPSGGFTFKLHPLVIMNVSDHHTRVKAQAASSGAGAGQPPRVFGCVIGVQRGRTVEIFNSFELVLDPVSGTLDHALLDKEQELYKAAFPDFYVLGWYSTGSDVHDTDMQIHKALMDINESVVYLLLNPTINLNLSRKDLPVTIYKSELGVIGGNPQLIFVKSDYTIAEDQAIYDKICHSVVEIVCYESVAPHDLICSIPGVITKLGDGYCHILAYNKENLFSSGQFELIFPDKEKMKMKISEEVLGQVGQRPPKLLPLCVSVNRSPQMKSVDFSKQDVSMNDEVFAVGFDINLPSYHLSPGNVTHEREEYFSYDSPAHLCTSWGDLVFNKQAELVGISCEDRGVTNALNVKSITKCLSSCYEGCYEGMTLDEILQSIDDQAKEMFGSRD